MKTGERTPASSTFGRDQNRIPVELQATRQEFSNLAAPSCGQEVRALTLEAMDASIEALHAVAAGEPDAVVWEKARLAKEKIDRSGEAMDRLLNRRIY